MAVTPCRARLVDVPRGRRAPTGSSHDSGRSSRERRIDRDDDRFRERCRERAAPADRADARSACPRTRAHDRRRGFSGAEALASRTARRLGTFLVTPVARLVRQPAMEFGLFVQAHVPLSEMQRNPDGAEHARLMREVDLAVACDDWNFKYVWSVEHHFLEEYSHISASEIVL